MPTCRWSVESQYENRWRSTPTQDAMAVTREDDTEHPDYEVQPRVTRPKYRSKPNHPWPEEASTANRSDDGEFPLTPSGSYAFGE